MEELKGIVCTLLVGYVVVPWQSICVQLMLAWLFACN